MKTSSNISTRKLVIGSVAVVVLAAAVFFFTFFQVKTVEVIGNDHYTEDELKEKILKGSMTSNAILAPLFYSKNAAEELPYIESFNVRRSGRNKLIISVKEKSVVGCIPYLDSYIYFDRTGTFVEGSQTLDKTVPYFDGIEVSKVVMYEKLDIKGDTVLNTAVALSTIFQKNDLVPDHIQFDNSYSISLIYGDITVQLGKDENLEEKMNRVAAILPKITGKKGILHMESVSTDTNTFEEEKEKTDTTSTSENWTGGYDENGDYTGDGEYDENGNYVGPKPTQESLDAESENTDTTDTEDTGSDTQSGDYSDGYSEDNSQEYDSSYSGDYSDYSDGYSDSYNEDYSDSYSDGYNGDYYSEDYGY